MDNSFDRDLELDEAAGRAGGYVVMPSKEEIEKTQIFMDVCAHFNIRYDTANTKQKALIDEIVRIKWERQHLHP